MHQCQWMAACNFFADGLIAALHKQTEHLASSWEVISNKLGLREEVIESLKEPKFFQTDDMRLNTVWNKWVNESDQLSNLKEYPPTREGLNKLLNDIEEVNNY